MSDVQQRLFKRVALRIMPFLMVLYCIAFIDRVNLSFAALTMNRDLGIGPRLFGWGAGIFFIGYFLFELPSNLLLARFGARRWIARIMITWGILAVGMAFVERPLSYLVMRFLLGVAEAGFFPGIILYLTYWLPSTERGRLNALFILAIPLSTMLNAPLSTYILGLEGRAGLHGWQWLFLLDGVPAVLLGCAVPFVLANGPRNARWLSAEERRQLLALLEADSGGAAARHVSLAAVWLSPAVLALSAVYFSMMIGQYGLGFWIPKMLSGMGLSARHTGWSTSIPYCVAAVMMWLWTRHSDRRQERVWHLTIAIAMAAAGLAMAALVHSLTLEVIAFSLVTAGTFSAMPVFWVLATQRLHGTAAAGAIAIINSIGNLGGFAGPALMGWLRQSTNSYRSGLIFLACCLLAGAALAFAIGRRMTKARVAGQPA